MSRRRAPGPRGEIAVIGMAGRHPKARNLDELWAVLRNGVDCISFLTDEDLEASGVDRSLYTQPNYVRARAVLEDIDLFDASFFGISPREAVAMDPQHRFFLETAYEALENAGYDPMHCPLSVGVFAGCLDSTYSEQLRQATRGTSVEFETGMQWMGYVATRVAFKLNLKGPAVYLFSACSTSLVAIVQACQSLLDYQCDMALAGGVAIGVPQKSGYLYHEGQIMSPDGICRPFDAKAQGTSAGDGVGIVLLKRLEDAIADGDNIRAVVKGASTNNDGAGKVSFAMPAVEGQAEVIEMALAQSGVDPATIGFVEGHGTATLVGDPAEVQALTRAFTAHTDKKHYCALGSIKSNMAHLNTAAGSAGFIKAVLALEHKQIPPSLHFEEPNPQIDWENSPFFVNTELLEWKAGPTPRRASVSSFGVGGTNAHVILEEAPAPQPADPGRAQHLVVLSARAKPALQAAADNLAAHLRAHPELNIADVAYTTQVSRSSMPLRRAVVCSSVEDAIEALAGNAPRRVFSGRKDAENPPVVFMFPGQGAQYVNMGRELYESEAPFRAEVDACAELLAPHLGLDLRTVLYPAADAADKAAEMLGQTWLTQPAIFTIEYALAKLWMAWGVRPQAMVGHSIGEFVAACLAGVLSLEAALGLVAARGRMMQDLPAGGMLSVPLPEEEVEPLTDGELSLAAVNSPSACVLSGPTEAIARLQARLDESDLPCQMLQTSHAFHSAMMQPIVEPFAELVRQAQPRPATIPCVSTVTGRWIEPGEWADPGYWARNLREPVRFSDSVLELLAQADRVLLEVGPGQTLSSLTRQHTAEAAGRTVLASMRHPREQQSDLAFLMGTLGRLWIAGVPIDWAGLHAGSRRRRLALPAYPFQRMRYWVPDAVTNGAAAPVAATPTASRSPFKKNPDVAAWFYAPGWKRTPPPGKSARTSEPVAGACTLVFLDERGVGEALAARLAGDTSAVRIAAGEQFAALGDNAYRVRPAAREDYDALLGDLHARGLEPERVVHLWGIAAPDQPPVTLDNLQVVQGRGFYSLMFLVQALEVRFPSAQVVINTVTDDLFDVLGGEAVHPARATALGLCRVVPQEYPNIRCRSIDVELGPDATVESAVAQLLRELAAPPDSLVAYRRGHRWVPTFEPAPRPPAPAELPVLRQGGVYLVTGGLGGIGLLLAEHLAEKLGAKLVLVGRSGLPPRSKWDAWLEQHGEEDRTSRRIRKVQAVEQRGGEVMVASADIADLEQMRQVVARARMRFGPIHGVIHAAGLNPGGFLGTRRPEDAATVMAPKVEGTLVLQELLRDEQLDFFALCSTTASIFGGIAFADYAGANTFLDVLVHSRDMGRAFPFVSINWDLWGEVGMGFDAKPGEEVLKNAITSAEGIEAFRRILADPQPQTIVFPRDFNTQLAISWGDAAAESAGDAAPAAAAEEEEAAKPSALGSAHPRPDLPVDYVAPRNEVESSIAEVIQSMLGIDKVGIHDNFFDLGFDSLLAHRAIGRLQQPLGMSLPMRVFLEIPTVAEIATFVEGFRTQNAPAGAPAAAGVGAAAPNADSTR